MTTFPAHCARRWRCLVAILIVLPAVSYAQAVSGVGFQPISIQDPVNGGTMPGYVFYPATSATGVTWRGPYELAATAGAPAIPGAKPLVVISHGHGGSDLGHHDLATYLAGHGFVVATLEHPKDNFHDMSGTGTPAVLVGRPIQVAATISKLLHDPKWKSLIDPARIGVAGFSAGGYTALMVVGAIPHFSRFIDYCKRHPKDAEDCEMLQKAEAKGTAKAELAKLQGSLNRWGATHDPRIKAAFVMAPLSLMFDANGLADIHVPVYLYYGQNDGVLLPKENALHIAPLIKTLVGIKMIPKAGHYVFLAPCSPQLTKEAPSICKDPPGVDRTKLHKQIDADALAFFNKTLAMPSHGHGPG
ncbi:MAG TPA: hypothetical protein VFL54_10870 [Gammaproteobacteria bacterium]|nr:hypothetical protein [Gammaproteobacteria bacterium]